MENKEDVTIDEEVVSINKEDMKGETICTTR